MFHLRVVLGCQGLNVWSVVDTGRKELIRGVALVSAFIETADLVLNSTLSIVGNKEFKCDDLSTNLNSNPKILSQLLKVIIDRLIN